MDRREDKTMPPDFYRILQKAMGNNGVRLPIKEDNDGKLIGTEMLYTDNKDSCGASANRTLSSGPCESPQP